MFPRRLVLPRLVDEETENTEISFRCAADVSLLPLLRLKRYPVQDLIIRKSLHLNKLLSASLVTKCENYATSDSPSSDTLLSSPG
jgi:hypothetical protein